MNKISERIFRNYKPNFGKLQSYGFVRSSDIYSFRTDIADGQFTLNVKISYVSTEASP